MIPKIIHYVWMGKGKKNDHIKQCMKTWEKHLSDYKVVEWNEDNFDINSHPFVKKAYENKQWAFVSDYVRFYAIYNYGGIYFDTDIVMVKDIDSLLENKAFVGFEDDIHPFTAVFGCEKHHEFARKILNYYDNINLDDFKFSFFDNNTLSVSDILVKDYDCKETNTEQLLKADIKVYPSYILCSPSFKSYTIHAFTSTWTDTVNHKSITRKFRMYFLTRCTNKFLIFFYLLLTKLWNLKKCR